MQITLEQLLELGTSPIFAAKLPAATSYKFAKLGKLIQREMETYEQVRQKLIEEHHGVQSADGSKFDFSDEDMLAFKAALKSLLETQVEIGIHFPLKIASLGDTCTLTPQELFAVEPILSEE